MRIDLNLTTRQAEKMADKLCQNGYFMASPEGNRLDYNSLVELIKMAFDTNGYHKIEEFQKSIK